MLVAGLVAVCTAVLGPAGTATADDVLSTEAVGPGLYIVTLTGEPSAVYDGAIPGYPATATRNGERFDRTRSAVASYEERLTERQEQLLSDVGDPKVVYRFTTAVNGFVAELRPTQVKALRAAPGVALVERSAKQRLDTAASPDFLGLTGSVGVWDRVGGPASAGKGTVVGVIDSGIWPENPSFAGLPLKANGVSDALDGFHGACQTGEQWTAGDCSEKVVSARYFVEGFGSQNLAAAEYLSPRDGIGHGSHTASIAAGNDAVAVEIAGQSFGQASGMAPAARIASYKACWTAPEPDDDGCTTADTVAAIDQAVADGVDVINYSISGARETPSSSVERAFLHAASAGVFVATSAGNEGPEPGSVAHPSPWVTTVAASSHHMFQGGLDLGDGTSYVGAMVSDEATPSAPLVLAEDAAAANASPDEARLCQSGALDAAQVEDTIVVCDRGVNARVDKSAAVARAGGVGMVLANVTPGSQDADFHAVPTVHVDASEGRAIKEYVEDADEDATASIDPAGAEETAVPQVAEFSSRGPSKAVGANLLKPDIAAPGVGVVSASSPADSGRLWDVYSGTSMSAPHIAGLAALVQAERPDWSPAAIKSAMMTTAYDVEGNNRPMAQGAGHVNPARFLDPGLVYDATGKHWRAYLNGAVDTSDVNVASIAVGDLTGRTVVKRTVTNVSGRTATFSAGVAGLDGVRATVVPDTLLLAPGESATFRVRLAAEDDAQMRMFTSGELTWTGLAGHEVAIPIVVRPRLVTAEREVSGSNDAGSVRITGRLGSDDSIDPSTAGLVGALPTPVSLVPGAFDPDSPRQDGDTLATTIEVPPGTEVARVAMDAHNSADDLDVFVYLDGELVTSSASSSEDETVTLVAPESGEYDVYVHSFSADNGATTTGQLYTWVVSPADAGNLGITPDAVQGQPGRPMSLEASWAGLDMTQRWFGAIAYDASEQRTFVTIK